MEPKARYPKDTFHVKQKRRAETDRKLAVTLTVSRETFILRSNESIFNGKVQDCGISRPVLLENTIRSNGCNVPRETLPYL